MKLNKLLMVNFKETKHTLNQKHDLPFSNLSHQKLIMKANLYQSIKNVVCVTKCNKTDKYVIYWNEKRMALLLICE